MNMFEAIVWVALGFAPTIAAMQAAWMMSHRQNDDIVVRA
jgi:hypothetical protein